MYSNNTNGSRAASARGFAALFAALAMGLALVASPAEGAPFAYVTNFTSANVSVIDTATKTPPTITRRHTGAIACDIELNLNF
jgi:DNA-binding beta-propeller fold protein YncE